MNAYEILNVPPTATREEIRAAYHQLARRWHPDRFMAGPERDWANDKMADINSAYRSCLDGLTDARNGVEGDAAGLQQVQQLVDEGRYSVARKKLMGLNTRCAEWNYLFGWVLMRQGELDKALTFLSVAAHQNAKSAKYARALREAERRLSTGAPNKLSRLLTRMRML